MELTIFSVFIFAFTLTTAFSQDLSPKITISTGNLQGSVEKARGGRDFYAFRGIPYGTVKERFQHSSPASSWDGTKQALSYGPVCPQFNCYSQQFDGVEDCLSVNVFTPKLPSSGNKTDLLPVVVTIHMGNHFFGSGQMYEPHYMMEEDTVVITFNYRLGLFGFLNTQDNNAPGNVGLGDQSLLLAWVRENVHKFSGDWERVSLMGQSSAGLDVLLHMTNPRSKGLFHRAVVQSGTLSSCSFTRDPVAQAKKVAEQVGCPMNNSTAFVKCLKGMEPLEILKKLKIPQDMDLENMQEMQNFAIFSPSIEYGTEDKLISGHPFKLLSNPEKVLNKVPVMIGNTVMEGLDPFSAMFFNDSKKLEKLRSNWTSYAPFVLDFDKSVVDEKTQATLAKRIQEAYSKDAAPLSIQQFIDIFTDKHYEHFSRLMVKTLEKSAIPVYRYRFQHAPEFTVVKDAMKYENIPEGPGSMDDLQYMYKMTESFMVPEITDNSTAAEYLLSKGMVRMLASFFDSGIPSKVWGEGKVWETSDSVEKFYEIDLVPRIKYANEDLKKRMKFWNQVFETDLKNEFETPKPEKF